MEVKYHPLVKRDIAETLRYYDKIAARLADEFEAEVKLVVERQRKIRFGIIPPGAVFAGQTFHAFRITCFTNFTPNRSGLCTFGTINGIRIMVWSENNAQ